MVCHKFSLKKVPAGEEEIHMGFVALYYLTSVSVGTSYPFHRWHGGKRTSSLFSPSGLKI
jgi:hypothetical protein